MAVSTADLDWIPVSSSNVAAIAWNEDFKRLFVRFHSGSTYFYDSVERATFYAFRNAPSKGQFVDRVLKKGGFAYKRIA